MALNVNAAAVVVSAATAELLQSEAVHFKRGTTHKGSGKHHFRLLLSVLGVVSVLMLAGSTV